MKDGGDLPKGGVVVEIGGGDYCLTGSLTLDKQDSGTKDAPIVYRGPKGVYCGAKGQDGPTDWRAVC